MRKRIPVAGPWITQKEIDAVADAARNAWYENANQTNERFEQAFASYVGTSFALALPSCTSAIHLSLVALGVGPGDEVIVPEITWIATAAPIHYVGARAVFADVDRATWCLDPASFEAAITPKTKAVIPVGLYGGMPDMARVLTIARRHRLAVVEDAAEALGSEYGGKRAGGFGDTGVFSFHGSKPLTTGEGGMLVTSRADVRDRALSLRDHGRDFADGRMFWNAEVGFKYKMSALQAALGLAQLQRVQELIARKREIFQWYREALRDVEGITLNAQPSGTTNSFWMATVVVDSRFGLQKEAVMQALREKAIDSRPFFYPLSMQPAYRDTEEAARARQKNRVAYEISPYGVNLPSALSLTREDVAYVCDTLRGILKDKSLAK